MQKTLKIEDGVRIPLPLKVITRDKVVLETLEEYGKCSFAYQFFHSSHAKMPKWKNRLVEAYKNKQHNTVMEFGPNRFGEREVLVANYFTCTLTHDLSTKVDINWYFKQMAKMYYLFANRGLIYPTILDSISMLELAHRDLETDLLFDNAGTVYSGQMEVGRVFKEAQLLPTFENLPGFISPSLIDLAKRKSLTINTDKVIATKVFYMFIFPYAVKDINALSGPGCRTRDELNQDFPIPGFVGEGEIGCFSDFDLVDRILANPQF